MRTVEKFVGRIGLLAAIALLAGPLLPTGAAQAPDDEKPLFCGFEKDMLGKYFPVVEQPAGDLVGMALPGDRRSWIYTMKKGVATQGEWSFVMDIGTGTLPRTNLKAMPWLSTGRPWSYSVRQWAGIWKPGATFQTMPGEKAAQIDTFKEVCLEANAGGLLYTQFGLEGPPHTPETFPRDWSGFSYLRADIMPDKTEVKIRMACEDDKVAPPVERRYVVPAGKWSTLQIDLDQAVKERNFDPGKIVNFWLYLEETAAPTLIYFDNIRLSKKDVKAKLDLPEGGPRLPWPTPPLPAIDRRTIKLDHSKLELGEPSKVQLKTPQNRPVGPIRIWAADNAHLLMDGGEGLIETADGGATWKPLGKLLIPGGISANPQGATTTDADGNVLIFGNYPAGCMLYHCSIPLDSMFFRKLVFDGEGFTPSPFYIVGGESRSCTQGRRITVLPNGRMWVAYKTSPRMAKAGPRFASAVRAMYSDDGGIHWRGAGVDGRLTGTLADTLVGGRTDEFSGTRNLYCDPMAIVPYGEHVAVIWSTDKTLDWSHFDGKAWSEQATIPTGFFGSGKAFPKFIAAVPQGKEIVISTDPGLICWDGSRWQDDALVQRAGLTRCGDKIAAFSVMPQDKEGSVILFWQRTPEGRWTSKEIAREILPVGFALYRAIGPYVAVPRVSPPNYAPIAWTCKDQTWVKVLRVPVE